MSRFLLAWEQGGGLGHLQKLRALASALAARGHEVVLAARDLVGVARVFGDACAAVQAPFLLPPPGGAPQAGYADLLARLGYTDAQVLGAITRGWVRTIELVAPDLLVAEHSPTALLAAQALGLRRAMVGTGFTCPPALSPLPVFDAADARKAAAAEPAVLSTMNQVLARLGASPMESAGGLFDLPTFACTFRELDVHARHRPKNAWFGPLDAGSPGETPPPWPGGQAHRVFAYLKSEVPGTSPLLDALGKSSAAVLAFVPGADRALYQRHESASLRLLPRPADLSALLAECHLLVCHGGHGTTCGALLAGVPVLVLPGNTEQLQTGSLAQAMGAGRLLDPRRGRPDPRAAIRRLLDDAQVRAGARDFAAHHAGFDPATAAAEVARRLEAVVAA